MDTGHLVVLMGSNNQPQQSTAAIRSSKIRNIISCYGVLHTVDESYQLNINNFIHYVTISKIL